MEGMVVLNKKEQKRLMVLNQVEKGRLGGGEAAGILGLSLRQVRRLIASYRRRGAAGLAMEIDKYTYRVTWSEEDGEYVGLCAEFPSLSWLADTQESALVSIKETVSQVIQDMQSTGETIPQPFTTRYYSGKFTVRIPPDVHRKLQIQAAESNISFNRLISRKLSS